MTSAGVMISEEENQTLTFFIDYSFTPGLTYYILIDRGIYALIVSLHGSN